jgi:hypothetical protein
MIDGRPSSSSRADACAREGLALARVLRERRLPRASRLGEGRNRSRRGRGRWWRLQSLHAKAGVRLAGSAGVQASTVTMRFSSASPAFTQGSVRSGIGVVLRACPGKEQRGEEMIDGNLLLCHRSTLAPMSSGRGSASASRWSDWESERKWGGGKWQEGESSRGSSWLINRGGGGGLQCTMSETIGRRWRCSGAALCARCRGLIGFVGGCLVQSEHEWFQSGCDRIQVRLGRVCARGGWATVASCWWHVAVQVLVRSGVRRRADAWEHAARSAHAGRHGGVGFAWSGSDMQWVRGGGFQWNWSNTCRGVRRRGDGSRCGRCCPAQNGRPRWAWRRRWRRGVLKLCLCKMGSRFGC